MQNSHKICPGEKTVSGIGWLKYKNVSGIGRPFKKNVSRIWWPMKKSVSGRGRGDKKTAAHPPEDIFWNSPKQNFGPPFFALATELLH
jgi:hypothetical protein